MRHQNYRFGSVINGIFDCRNGASNSLVVCYSSAIKRDVEIDLKVGVSKKKLLLSC